MASTFTYSSESVSTTSMILLVSQPAPLLSMLYYISLILSSKLVLSGQLGHFSWNAIAAHSNPPSTVNNSLIQASIVIFSIEHDYPTSRSSTTSTKHSHYALSIETPQHPFLAVWQTHGVHIGLYSYLVLC